jgi:hypothetical protein
MASILGLTPKELVDRKITIHLEPREAHMVRRSACADPLSRRPAQDAQHSAAELIELLRELKRQD